jgi:hypothetical protein
LLFAARERHTKNTSAMSDDLNAHFYCPITSELMTDPVIDADGNTFERSAIERMPGPRNM